MCDVQLLNIVLQKSSEHTKSIVISLEIRFRLISIARRVEENLKRGPDNSCWPVVPIPRMEKDLVGVWGVFRHDTLSSTFKKSSVVLLDIRKKKIGTSNRHRVFCLLCPGFVANRMLCSHENELVNYLNFVVERGKDTEKDFNDRFSDDVDNCMESHEPSVPQIIVSADNVSFRSHHPSLDFSSHANSI